MQNSTLFINGQFEKLLQPHKDYESYNPCDGKVLNKFTIANQFDVNKAVAAASIAFKKWKLTSGKERAQLLNKVAEVVKQHKEDLSWLETLDTGKPYKECEWDIDDVAGCFEYFANKAIELDERQYEKGEKLDDGFVHTVVYEPVGVVGAVVPFNYPLLMATWKIAPALAAGCTIILKPSEYTVQSIIKFCEITKDIIPSGVLNILTGPGHVGAMLVEHKNINKVAFTGSVPTGIKVGHAAINNVNQVTLELGGKSPIIVFDDCDLVKAVEWTMFGCFWTNGQICSATSRLLLHSKIADKFLNLLIKATQQIPIVNVCKPENKELTGALGPVISEKQHNRVLNMINNALKQGAEVLCGGKRPNGDEYGDGYYVEPTILKVKENMSIWNDEVFGPVLSVMIFDDENQAIEMANNSEYGLAAAVMTNDIQRFNRICRALDTGLVWHNTSQPCFSSVPWGGTKKSGIGRELGRKGIDNYLEPKQIVSYTSNEPLAWYKMPSPKL